MTVNLDDITKTSFCIPFKQPSNEHTGRDSPFPSTPHPSRDLPLPVGNELRFEAYRVAWSRCLGRMQDIITNLQKSTVEKVVNAVAESDSTPNPCMTRLPGLPRAELPVIVVINASLGPSFLHKIITELETKDANNDAMDTDFDDSTSPTSTAQPPPPCLILNCRAGDFPNVTAGMKAVITGFVHKREDLHCGEKKTTTAAPSLARYDIGYLQAWYESLASTAKDKKPSKLVVILHDFEQFDPCVMQDVFYICSQALPSLPITFILSLSSPLPNYLNVMYPATTLSLMRVCTIKAPGGGRILSEVLRKTFFDVGFDPDIVIGPSALEFMQDFFTRHHSSIDVLLTVVQLVHLKHFTSDPLAALVHSTPSTQNLTQPEFANFVESLWTRLRLGSGSSLKAARNDKSQPVAKIIEAINKAREDFHVGARDMRVGFKIMHSLQVELRSAGYKGLEWASDGEGDVGVDVMLDLLRGRLGRDVRLLGTIVKKLKIGELQSVLDRLNTNFFELPAHARVRTAEQEARSHLILLRARVSQDGESHVDVAEELSEWLKEYLSEKLRPLEELELWDVWYTRNTPPPSELLNPSVRACVVAGLLRPYDYEEPFGVGASTASGSRHGSGDVKEKGKGKGRPLWELPDISILFRRYLDSGRMINVFDWFESFKGVLEVQRRCSLTEVGGNEADEADVGKRDMSRSPRKKRKEKKSKGKGKEKEKEVTGEDEEWKLEVQARFIRALHELDYLGFVRHTGRKRDHVLRVVFDVGDDEEDDD